MWLGLTIGYKHASSEQVTAKSTLHSYQLGHSQYILFFLFLTVHSNTVINIHQQKKKFKKIMSDRWSVCLDKTKEK